MVFTQIRVTWHILVDYRIARNQDKLTSHFIHVRRFPNSKRDQEVSGIP